MVTDTLPSIAIIGGTGALGSGLAMRWVQKNVSVIIGSRNKDSAELAVKQLTDKLGDKPIASLQAMENVEAAKAADIIVVTVPFSHQQETLESIKAAVQGKIVVDTTVPLVPPKVARVQLPESGSAGQRAQAILGDEVKVVSALQNVAAHHLQELTPLDCDIIVCGNNKAARAEVIELIQIIGMKGFHGGSINNAAAQEALTSVLIFINKQYGGHAGIKITGLDQLEG